MEGLFQLCICCCCSLFLASFSARFSAITVSNNFVGSSSSAGVRAMP
jgi:hypothetical protein